MIHTLIKYLDSSFSIVAKFKMFISFFLIAFFVISLSWRYSTVFILVTFLPLLVPYILYHFVMWFLVNKNTVTPENKIKYISDTKQLRFIWLTCGFILFFSWFRDFLIMFCLMNTLLSKSKCDSYDNLVTLINMTATRALEESPAQLDEMLQYMRNIQNLTSCKTCITSVSFWAIGLQMHLLRTLLVTKAKKLHQHQRRETRMVSKC